MVYYFKMFNYCDVVTKYQLQFQTLHTVVKINSINLP